jgi:hypothetical protein
VLVTRPADPGPLRRQRARGGFGRFCGCAARATVPASVGSEAAGACGEEGPRLRTRIGRTAAAKEPTRVFGQGKGRSQTAAEHPGVLGQ